ncbi:MAG: hypothetical protein ACE5OZ_22350 [Candidatus Heimdallarchaeota archaeon]
MDVLDVDFLRDKMIKIIIIEADYPLEDSIVMKKVATSSVGSEHYSLLIEMLIEKLSPNFLAEDLGTGSKQAIETEAQLVELLQRKQIPYKAIDFSKQIPESLLRIDAVLDWLWDIETELEEELKTSERYEHFMNLYSWYYCHKEEDTDLKNEVTALVHEAGFILGILEEAQQIKKKQVTLFLITTHSHFLELKELFNNLNIQYEERLIEDISNAMEYAPLRKNDQ